MFHITISYLKAYPSCYADNVVSYHLLWHTRGFLYATGKISFYSRTANNRMMKVIPQRVVVLVAAVSIGA